MDSLISLSEVTKRYQGRAIGQNGALGANIAIGPKGIDIAGMGRCPNIKPPHHGQTPMRSSRDAQLSSAYVTC